MICYKGTTFCSSNCTNSKCPRFIYKGLDKEAAKFGLLVAYADFSLDCDEYENKYLEEMVRESERNV